MKPLFFDQGPQSLLDKAVAKLLQKVKSNLKVLTRQMTTELLKRLAAPQVKDYPQDVIGEEGAEGEEEGGSEEACLSRNF